MKKGILIIAHNNRDVDYALMSLISGGLAKKFLNVPASLITDESTVSWMKESGIYEKSQEVFEHIILVDRPEIYNYRKLNDGVESKNVPFINSTRPLVWDLTPYDRTLLIDSDFLIMSDRLNEFWDVDESVIISESINDIKGDRLGYLDKHVSEVSAHLYWATTVMFTKNNESKLFFDTVKQIENNYDIFGDLFRFSTRQYRNDVAFSVAKHILDGYQKSQNYSLPPVLTVQDKDFLIKVDGTKLNFIISDSAAGDKFYACGIKDQDVHIMNKQNIIRMKDSLLELI